MRFKSVSIATCLCLLYSFAGAQETIYVGQNNPTGMHAFTFDGASFSEQVLDPSNPGNSILGGMSPFAAATTNHLFLFGGIQGLELSVVDPFTRRELPRVRGPVFPASAILTTADQHFAFVLGTDQLGTAWLSVVDILPSSATFLQAVSNRSLLPVSGSSDSILQSASLGNALSGALSPDGSTLYVAVEDGDLGNDGAVIAVNVTNPLSPTVSDGIRIPYEPAVSIRYGTIGGSPFLFSMSGDLVLVPITGSSFGSPVVLASHSPDSADTEWRIMTDIFVEDGVSPKAFVVSSSCTDASCFQAYEELLTIDLSGALSDNSSDTCANHPCVASRYLFNTGVADPFQTNLIRGSAGGQYVYVLSQASDSFFWCPSELLAFDLAALNADSPTPLLTRTNVDSLSVCPPDVSSTDFVAWAVSLDVQNAVTQTPPSVTISDANTEVGKIFTNDASHTVTATGTNLNTVVHAYLNRTELTNLSATTTTLTATVPRHLPSGNPVLLLADSSGGLTQFTGPFTVNDPPQYLPKAVVYATGGSCNQYSQINTASGSEVVSNFPTISQGPFFGLVTKDGNYLLTSGFNDGRLTVHSLLNNHSYGWNQPVESLYAAGTNSVIQHLIQNPGAGRNTVYINNLGGKIYMLDPTAFPPSLIDADANAATKDNRMPAGINGIPLPSGGERALAISADGHWLYTVNRASPAVIRIDVSTDTVTAANVSSYPISGLASGRVDGLALSSDGTKMFLASANDSFVRIFARNTSDGSVATGSYAPLSPSSDPWSTGDVRVILAPPDGRFLYVTSRAEQRLDIFDVHDLSNITYVTKIPLPLDAQFMDVTPRNPNTTNTNDYLFVAAPENDSVTAIYEGPTTSSLAQHQILTVTGAACGAVGIAVSPGAGTSSGSNVSVAPTQDSSVTYSNVTTSGNTSVTSTNTSSLTTPPTFEIAGSTPVYYDVSTTASFSGPVAVCFQYDDTGMTPQQEAALRLLHESSGTFSDVTSSLDTTTNTICGTVTSFSQFVLAQTTTPASVSGPGGFSARGNGPLNVTIFGSASFDATQIDPGSLKLLSQGIVSTSASGAKAAVPSDSNKDGHLDLKVAFPRQALLISGTRKSTGTIYLQGRLSDGTAFAGQAQLTLK